MPADKAGLKKGDLLIAVNGQPIHSQIKFQEITKNSGGKPIEIEYQRNGEKHSVTVQPVFAKIDGPARWMIGVVPQQKLDLITTRLSFPDALRESRAAERQGRAADRASCCKGMVERRMSAKNLTGPIGIAQLSGDAAREGPSAFFMLMAMVSLQPGHLQPAADSDSGRRRDPDAAGRDGHAARPQPEREGSGV